MKAAVFAFTVWTLFLMLMAAFSAFGTACNTCQAQINRGTLIICFALASIYSASLWLATRTDIFRKKMVIVASGVAAVTFVTFALVQLLMPV
jgi:hypothetical protein